jgi:hypothetical protein
MRRIRDRIAGAFHGERAYRGGKLTFRGSKLIVTNRPPVGGLLLIFTSEDSSVTAPNLPPPRGILGFFQ